MHKPRHHAKFRCQKNEHVTKLSNRCWFVTFAWSVSFKLWRILRPCIAICLKLTLYTQITWIKTWLTTRKWLNIIPYATECYSIFASIFASRSNKSTLNHQFFASLNICVQIWINQLLIFIEKFSPLLGFEHRTSRVPSRCATN